MAMFTNWFKSARKCSRQEIFNEPEFIKEFVSNHPATQYHIAQKVDLRRVVFVSLIGLYRTYHKCPIHILFSAILILPLQQKWVYEPDKYLDELIGLSATSRITFTNELIKLIKWKDSQQLVCWMSDDVCTTGQIACCYRDLSQKLTTLCDPVTGGKYKAIQFEPKWWMQSNKSSKFGVNTADILKELCCVDLKFKVVQEIVYRSNPSLNPITFYGQNNDNFVQMSLSVRWNAFYKRYAVEVNEDEDGEWHISVDYAY